MLFNTLHREGNNLAMASGKMAAEAAIEALRRGDFSRHGLAGYGERLAASYVIRDMKKYRRFNRFLHRRREVFNELPALASQAAREMLTVNGVSKKKKQQLIFKEIRRKIGICRLLRLFWQGWRAVK